MRESAGDLSAAKNVYPILEPVKPLNAIFARRLMDIHGRGQSCGLVLNPSVGDHRSAGDWLNVGQFFLDNDLLGPHGLAILSNSQADHVAMSQWVDQRRADGLDFPVDIIHELDLSVSLTGSTYRNVRWNVAEDRTVPAAYGLPLSGRPVIWANDPFPALPANREYVGRPEGIFSTRPGSYRSAGYAGISEFLTIGARYQDGGGPAYAVVIHLTYAANGIIRLVHFCSNTNHTQDDPGGKFLEALDKLVAFVRSNSIARNPAIDIFFDLHARQHFPGLGPAKQYAMMNHMYVMSAVV